MNVIEIPERKIVKEYPECFEELIEKQFDFVMQQVVKLMDGKIDIDMFKVLVLYHFLDLEYTALIKKMEKFRKNEDLQTRNYNVWRMCQTLNWFFVDKEIEDKIHQVFAFDSVRNFIPKLHARGEWYYGPADALMNISMGEFRAAVDYFGKYAETKEVQYLNLLVAVLYRPERDNYPGVMQDENFDGQRRVKFNRNHTERYANELKHSPFYQRYAIYLWFGNCNNFLREGEIELEGNKINLADLYKKQSNNQDSKDELGYTGLLFRLADEGTFGDIDKTDATGIYDIMLKLYQWKQDSDALKKLHNDTSNNL